MTSEIFKDIGDIYARLFDHRPFLSGEISFFSRELEEKRADREIENLFTAVETTSELRTNTLNKCLKASEKNLPKLEENLATVLSACTRVLNRIPDPSLTLLIEKNRETRRRAWQEFIDDMRNKCIRIDLTFEEKEEELSEFYSDLEQKLHIHK